MAKPPTTDQELTARVAALEQRMTVAETAIDEAETDIDDLDARVSTLEGGTVDPLPPDPPDPNPEPGVRVPLKVSIAYNGLDVQYDELVGTVRQNYVDPKGEFEQRSIQLANVALPNILLHIRPDVDGKREEVVIENTSIESGKNPGVLKNYKVTIMQGDTVLHEETVPQHYGYSRWRWFSSPRPVRETVADLIARGLLLNYKEELARQTPHSQVHTYTTMGLAGITGSMTGTGERPDIGPVTEYQGDYICNGANLSTVIAQGEACGTLPIHWRDKATGAWIDPFVTHPKASQYNSGSPNPYLPTDWALNPDNGDRVATIQCDAAHFPAVAYLPWLLTGDPYYVEELHAIVLFTIISQPWNGREFNIWFAIRAHAWSLRSVMQAAKTTPDVTPDWMLPKSFFVNYMNQNRDWLLNGFVNNTAAPYPLFATTEKSFGDNDESPAAPQSTYSQTYMEEFELVIFAWAVRMGFADWKPIVEWKAKNTIGRTDGKSGWVRAISTPYRQNLRPAKTAPWCATWKDSWDLTNSRYHFTFTDPNVLAITGNDISYPSYTEGALAAAKSVGVTAAAASHEWIHGQVETLINGSTGRSRARKWCISG